MPSLADDLKLTDEAIAQTWTTLERLHASIERTAECLLRSANAASDAQELIAASRETRRSSEAFQAAFERVRTRSIESYRSSR